MGLCFLDGRRWGDRVRLTASDLAAGPNGRLSRMQRSAGATRLMMLVFEDCRCGNRGDCPSGNGPFASEIGNQGEDSLEFYLR